MNKLMPNIAIYTTQEGKSKLEVVRRLRTTAKDQSSALKDPLNDNILYSR